MVGPESVKASDLEIKAKRNSALSSAIIEEIAKQLESKRDSTKKIEYEGRMSINVQPNSTRALFKD